MNVGVKLATEIGVRVSVLDGVMLGATVFVAVKVGVADEVEVNVGELLGVLV